MATHSIGPHREIIRGQWRLIGLPTPRVLDDAYSPFWSRVSRLLNPLITKRYWSTQQRRWVKPAERWPSR